MAHEPRTFLASFEILLAALGWSALGALVLLLPDTVSPLAISGLRGVCISMAFVAISLYRRTRFSFRLPVIGAGLCYAASALTYIISLRLLPVVVATPLHYTTPGWMVAGLYLMLRRRPSRAEFAGVIISLLGACLLITSGNVTSIAGVLAALASAILWAGYLYLQGDYSAADKISASAWGGIGLMITGLPDAGVLTLTSSSFSILMMIGIFSSILPLLLVSHASKNLAAVPLSLLLLSEPGFAALLAYGINGQAPSVVTLTGLILITFGAVFGLLFPARCSSETSNDREIEAAAA